MFGSKEAAALVIRGTKTKKARDGVPGFRFLVVAGFLIRVGGRYPRSQTESAGTSGVLVQQQQALHRPFMVNTIKGFYSLRPENSKGGR
jgi:hypothetical protein